MIIPQEALYLKKHNLADKKSTRFFFFIFEIKSIVKQLSDDSIKKGLQRKIRLKQIGNAFGIIALSIYTYLLMQA